MLATSRILLQGALKSAKGEQVALHWKGLKHSLLYNPSALLAHLVHLQALSSQAIFGIHSLVQVTPELDAGPPGALRTSMLVRVAVPSAHPHLATRAQVLCRLPKHLLVLNLPE
ncbi:hypothetical protein FRC05_002190 [Tulasnella sp. 425]|nr:hypothetical protein FRC05_002190 [Tulasnella sp. 425]